MIFILLGIINPEKVKQNLGLDKANFLYSGAASIKLSTLKLLSEFNIQILEVFGMSESTGIILKRRFLIRFIF